MSDLSFPLTRQQEHLIREFLHAMLNTAQAAWAAANARNTYAEATRSENGCDDEDILAQLEERLDVALTGEVAATYYEDRAREKVLSDPTVGPWLRRWYDEATERARADADDAHTRWQEDGCTRDRSDYRSRTSYEDTLDYALRRLLDGVDVTVEAEV